MRSRTWNFVLLVPILAFTFAGCNRSDKTASWHTLRNQNSVIDAQCLYSSVSLPDHPLILDEIIAIAMEQNLSLKVKQQEYCIQREAVTRERFNMLPKILLNWENYGRTENTASFSQSLEPGVPPAPLSISSEQNIRRWDLNLVWNLVDFGLAFYRSRQESNKVLMAQLEYERLRQNMVVDITKQYWKAIVAKLALQKSMEIVDKALEQQATLHRQMQAKIVSEIQGLRNENQLINIRGQLQAYSAQYHSAMSELSLLMGVPADVEMTLAEIKVLGIDVDIGDVGELESFALINRPELYSSDVEEKIRMDEARLAIVQMLPGVELFGGPYNDSNFFLLYNNWLAAGARATWNLLNIPGYNMERRMACGRKTLVRLNRLALSIGVIAQVHLSHLLFHDNLESYIIAKELESVNKRMLLAAKNEQRQGKLHEADILKYEAEALFSEIDASTKYAELQNSLEQLNSAIGLPRYFQTEVIYAEPPEEEDLHFETNPQEILYDEELEEHDNTFDVY